MIEELVITHRMFKEFCLSPARFHALYVDQTLTVPEPTQDQVKQRVLSRLVLEPDELVPGVEVLDFPDRRSAGYKKAVKEAEGLTMLVHEYEHLQVLAWSVRRSPWVKELLDQGLTEEVRQVGHGPLWVRTNSSGYCHAAKQLLVVRSVDKIENAMSAIRNARWALSVNFQLYGIPEAQGHLLVVEVRPPYATRMYKVARTNEVRQQLDRMVELLEAGNWESVLHQLDPAPI